MINYQHPNIVVCLLILFGDWLLNFDLVRYGS